MSRHADNAKGTVPARPPARGFTLVELLVTITIIGMLAGLTMGALQAARQSARASKTKSTITKLNHVIMARYESYLTRRVPIRTRGMEPKAAAQMRLDALRDLMRMEMPERWTDLSEDPYAFAGGPIDPPALFLRYREQYQAVLATVDAGVVGEFAPAECLYMIVSLGSPEAMESFNQNEIGDADGDGLLEFHDGWDRPIMFLRWAPGFTPESDIQTGDAVDDHDPFDTRRLDETAYRLIPLIYSGGPDKKYDLFTDDLKFEDPPSSGKFGYRFNGNPYRYLNGRQIGQPEDDADDPDGMDHYDNITNHAMTQD